MTVAPHLEIVAPAAALDPLAPWFGARTSSERALAATYWTSFGGLSGLFHATAIFFALAATLLPIPFLSDACSQVRPVAFRPPDRVVMSIVEVEQPPVVEEVPPPPVEVLPASPKGSKAKKLEADLERMNVGMLALIGSSDSSSGAFASLLSADDNNVVLGGLMGDQIGDAFGAGGLGLSGVGVAGGVEGGVAGGTAIGLGGLGTIGHGSGGDGAGYGTGRGSLSSAASDAVRVQVVDTDLERAGARRALLRKAAELASCGQELPADFTLRVRDGTVASVEGAPPCVARALRTLPIAGTGYVAVHVEQR